MSQDHTAKLIQDANDLIVKVQADLKSAQEFYASIGVSPDKVQGVLQSLLGPEEAAEVVQLLADDQQAIVEELAEEAAHMSFVSAPITTGRKKNAVHDLNSRHSNLMA